MWIKWIKDKKTNINYAYREGGIVIIKTKNIKILSYECGF